MKDWKPDSRAYVRRWLEEAAANGEIDLRAKRLGVSYAEAMVSLAEELERPYRAIEEKYGVKRGPKAFDEDEARLDERARSYAKRHRVSYAVALEATLTGEPHAPQAPVVLHDDEGDEEAATLALEAAANGKEAPPVDFEDADLDRRAQERARRRRIGYTEALNEILEGRA